MRTERCLDNGRIREPLLVKVSDAARLLSISRSKAYELIASGKLGSVKIGQGGMIRVPYACVLRIAENTEIVERPGGCNERQGMNTSSTISARSPRGSTA